MISNIFIPLKRYKMTLWQLLTSFSKLNVDIFTENANVVAKNVIIFTKTVDILLKPLTFY